jgi:hypothetical protein
MSRLVKRLDADPERLHLLIDVIEETIGYLRTMEQANLIAWPMRLTRRIRERLAAIGVEEEELIEVFGRDDV